MSSAVGVRALGAQDVSPLAAVVTEVPRADPLAASGDLATKTPFVVTLCTASLVAHQ